MQCLRRGSHPPYPPFAENVQLLSRVFPGVCGVFSQPRQGEGSLDQDHQADLCLGPLQSTTMQAAEIAMSLRVAKATFDHRSAQAIRCLGLLRLHPRLVCLDEFFPFQALDGSTLLRIADTTLTPGTSTAVLRRAVEAMLGHCIVVTPSFLLLALVIQSVSLRTAIRPLFGEPFELVLANARRARLGSLLFGEIVLLHRCDQADIPLLTFLQVQQRSIERVRADLNEHGAGDLLCSVEHRRQRAGISHLSKDVERQDQQRCGIHDKFGCVHRTEDFLFITAQRRLRFGDTDFDLFSGQLLVLGALFVLGQSVGQFVACQAVSFELYLPTVRGCGHPIRLRFDRLTGRVLGHGRVQFLESLRELVLVDQLMPRSAGPDGCAVEHGVLGVGEPFNDGLSDRLGVHVEDRLRQPIPKGVQGGSAGQDPLTEPSQGVAVWYVVCPLCRREAASAGLVQDHFEHEVWVVGEGPDPKVTRLQTGSIQSVNEGVDDAGAVVDLQRGVPLLPPRGARRRGRGSKVAFLVTEFRLPSSSWPPCLTTIKNFAHHARFAKTQGGHFSSPRRLSPPESWTFSRKGGKGPLLSSVIGEGIAPSRLHAIARNKNTRLETIPPARSTPHPCPPWQWGKELARSQRHSIARKKKTWLEN